MKVTCVAVGVGDFAAAGHSGKDGIGSLVGRSSELDTQLIFREFINGEV